MYDDVIVVVVVVVADEHHQYECTLDDMRTPDNMKSK